jgi:hypothetical protein
MATDVEKKGDETRPREEIVYKADPFTFIFRELDLMHNEIREVKGELVNVNKRIDDLYRFIIGMNDSINKRFDSMSDSINKRFDRLYIVVILNLIGITAFLIKEFFF